MVEVIDIAKVREATAQAVQKKSEINKECKGCMISEINRAICDKAKGGIYSVSFMTDKQGKLVDYCLPEKLYKYELTNINGIEYSSGESLMIEMLGNRFYREAIIEEFGKAGYKTWIYEGGDMDALTNKDVEVKICIGWAE